MDQRLHRIPDPNSRVIIEGVTHVWADDSEAVVALQQNTLGDGSDAASINTLIDEQEHDALSINNPGLHRIDITQDIVRDAQYEVAYRDWAREARSHQAGVYIPPLPRHNLSELYVTRWERGDDNMEVDDEERAHEGHNNGDHDGEAAAHAAGPSNGPVLPTPPVSPLPAARQLIDVGVQTEDLAPGPTRDERRRARYQQHANAAPRPAQGGFLSFARKFTATFDPRALLMPTPAPAPARSDTELADLGVVREERVRDIIFDREMRRVLAGYQAGPNCLIRSFEPTPAEFAMAPAKRSPTDHLSGCALDCTTSGHRDKGYPAGNCKSPRKLMFTFLRTVHVAAPPQASTSRA